MTDTMTDKQMTKGCRAMRHPHADLIIRWAEDTSREVQCAYHDAGDYWFDCSPYDVISHSDRRFRLKPIAPRMIRITHRTEGGYMEYEYPEPERVAPKEGTEVYMAAPTNVTLHAISEWNDDGTWVQLMFSRGLVHLTAEAAIAHAKALLGGHE